jgi:hypothetical protein
VALALLAATFRRTVPAHHVARAVGLTGIAGALLCAGLSVAMNLAASPRSASVAATNPAGISAYAGSAVMMVLIIWQSMRTLRVASSVRQ